MGNEQTIKGYMYTLQYMKNKTLINITHFTIRSDAHLGSSVIVHTYNNLVLWATLGYT